MNDVHAIRYLKRDEKADLFMPPNDATGAKLADAAAACGTHGQLSIRCGASPWIEDVVKTCCSSYVCDGKQCSVTPTPSPTTSLKVPPTITSVATTPVPVITTAISATTDTRTVTALTCILVAVSLICLVLLYYVLYYVYIGREGTRKRTRAQQREVVIRHSRNGKNNKDGGTGDENTDGSVASEGSWFGKSICIMRRKGNELPFDNEDNVSSIGARSMAGWFQQSIGAASSAQDRGKQIERSRQELDLMLRVLLPGEVQDSPQQQVNNLKNEGGKCENTSENEVRTTSACYHVINTGTKRSMIEDEEEEPFDVQADAPCKTSHIVTDQTSIAEGSIENDLEHYCSVTKFRQWVQTHEGYEAYCKKSFLSCPLRRGPSIVLLLRKTEPLVTLERVKRH